MNKMATQTFPQLGDTLKVRLFTYKSRRHYGGRDVTTFPHICNAKFLYQQTQWSFVVELLEPCAAFPAGHKIAVIEKDFNITE
jgi:hypothetical protein